MDRNVGVKKDYTSGEKRMYCGPNVKGNQAVPQ